MRDVIGAPASWLARAIRDGRLSSEEVVRAHLQHIEQVNPRLNAMVWTFLAKVIGWKACQANQRVLFTTAMDMLNQLSASQVDHSLVRKLKGYTEPSLLICDELGYLALDQQTSNLFYQVISTRHSQKKSTVITTNTPFSDWGNILYNTTIATAIADRLVENSEIFLLGGDSLRKANKNSSSPEE